MAIKSKLVTVDEEVWRKLYLLKMFLRKKTINDVVRQVLEEWELTRLGRRIRLKKK